MIKFVKPYYPVILCVILLLLLQSVCDLNLPNYMSNIVNVGVQKYGVENAAPDAVSEQGLELITSVMPEAEREEFLSSYERFEGSSTRNVKIAYGKLNTEFPGGLYTLKKGADIEKLNSEFSRAVSALMTVMTGAAERAGAEVPATGEGMITDITAAYAAIPMLKMLPAEMIDDAWEEAGKQPELLTSQIGVVLTRLFYTELGADMVAVQRAYIIRIGLMMLGIALASGGIAILVGLLSARFGSGTSRRLRNAIFTKIESLTSAEMDKFSTASLITRCTNDVMQIHMVFTMGLRFFCYSPMMAIGGVIMALQKSTSMSWIIALACTLVIGLIGVVIVVAMPKFQVIQNLVDKLNLVAREGLSGLMVIRAFSTERHEEGRFEAANTDLAKTNLFVNRVMAFMMPAMMLVMNGLQILVMWVGAQQISESAMQVGDMMAFIQYLTQILMAFLMMAMVFVMVPRALVAMGRVNEVLNTEPSIRDPEQSKGFDSARRGYVEFKNVNFRYNEAEYDAISNVSFTARPGATLAIIGSTGSGKTTIANLIMRFFDVTGGQILVNGTDVREVKQPELRSTIGYVPQKGMLLSGTIASNIAYGSEDITDEELEEAARIAQAADFINEKPDGFYSEISQSGSNVSGGQRQRLSIARALAKKPDIFIFDDSFSALDFKTDAALRRELNAHVSNATVIVVAQRVSTIMNADEILVLDEGKIVGRGRHSELIETCPQYNEIASSQMEKEEIA